MNERGLTSGFSALLLCCWFGSTRMFREGGVVTGGQ